MSDSDTPDSIDWNRYWSDLEDPERTDANPSGLHAREVVEAFLAARGAPDSFADVGCGAGTVAFAVADAYPQADVAGFDAADPVLAENRERAADRDGPVPRFERAVLPEFDPDRQFDVVFSYFTLCYVRDVERAVRNLYDAVAPGGDLVFNYHNTLAQAHYRRVAENPEEHLPEDSPFDPDRYADRFELVLEGESLLSYDRIHETLGTWPRSVYSVVERPDKRWAWRHNPLVYVPK